MQAGRMIGCILQEIWLVLMAHHDAHSEIEGKQLASEADCFYVNPSTISLRIEQLFGLGA
ncbi:hypothetical protein ATY76_22465 [Rhizobium sp. R339]|nr:hypothetical protein ATY76_22465 [Rhizobium sp. R339]